MTAQGTAIEWTHIPGFKGETWNPVTGCDRISPGCSRCYARTMARRLKAMGQPHYQRDGDGPGFGVSTHDDTLDAPLRWKKPRAVFVNSMSDLFHDEVPDSFIADVYDTIRLTPQHVYMVLTKRPERACDWHTKWAPAFQGFPGTPWPLPNLWLGVSIENARFTWRADVLREIPAAVRFISAEPLLGSLFQDARDPNPPELTIEERRHIRAPLNLEGIDWVIVGGESGHGARPMHPDWAREIRDACDSLWPTAKLAERPAFFFKQWGEWAPSEQCGVRNVKLTKSRFQYESQRFAADATRYKATEPDLYSYPGMESLLRVGKKRAGRLLDGREWSEFPRSAA